MSDPAVLLRRGRALFPGQANYAPVDTKPMLADDEGPNMWQTPVQTVTFPRQHQVQGVAGMMKKLREDWDKPWSARWEECTFLNPMAGLRPKTRLYLPKHRQHQCDLEHMTTEMPYEEDEGDRRFGYDVWEVMTTNRWLEQVSEFAMTSGLEMIDLQSDITLAVSIFIDEAYDGVPAKLKVEFVVLTALAFLLEVAIAFRSAWEARNNVEPCSKNLANLVMSTFLNWLATPVNIIVAPRRLAPYGVHKDGRNLGSIEESDGLPLIMLGQSDNLDYLLHSRHFLVRLPKVLFENILLFALTLYIQLLYVGRWRAAAIFSVATSSMSLVLALYRTLRLYLDVRRAKRYMQRAREDTEGFINDYDKQFAKDQLDPDKWNLIACRLL